MLMFQYLQNNSHRPVLEGIARPTAAPNGRLEVLKAGLAHEQYVTNLIHTIYDAAYEVKDFRTMQFLDWFVKEQGEEEKTAEDMIKKMPKASTCSTVSWRAAPMQLPVWYCNL